MEIKCCAEKVGMENRKGYKIWAKKNPTEAGFKVFDLSPPTAYSLIVIRLKKIS